MGAAVPEGINVLQKEPSGNITNTTISLGSDEERKNQLLLYAGLACIGFIGALLLDPPVEEVENVMRKSQRKVRERVRDQMKVLLSDPLFLIIASFNACCFSISIYLHSLGPKIYEDTFATLWNITDVDEIKIQSNDQNYILKTIYMVTHALGYILIGFAGKKNSKN